VHSAHGGDFYQDQAAFLTGGYFPELDAHKLLLTDVMEMYPQPDKSPTNSVDTNRKRKVPVEERGAPEDVKQVRLMPADDQKKYMYLQDSHHGREEGGADSRHLLRQNHSEIEKRRRDKMNTYISELSSMIPTCKAMSRKMDKLTVLRLAVQHLKAIRGSLDSYTEGNYKPPMLTDKELKQLIIPSADGFLFVVDSARGRILYVSESVSQTLNFSHQDLIGQSLFDILHPKDIPKVKEQLSNCDSTPRERLIDSKTLLPVKGGDVPQSITRLHPGARRVFFCRMKCKQADQMPIKVEEEVNPGPMLNSGYSSGSSTSSTNAAGRKKKKSVSTDKKYLSIQCTGYLKSWPLTKVGLEPEATHGSEEGDPESCMSCLVAVGKIQPSFQTTIEDCLERGDTTAHGVEFTSRHSTDGRFSYVDQRVTLLLGYLPQELNGTSLYEHIQYDDIPAISECHRNALKSPQEVQSPFFRFRAKDGKFVKLESKWKQFRNPWTKEIEYLICKNHMLITNEKMEGGGSFVGSGDMEFFQNGSSRDGTESGSPGSGPGRDIQRVITSHADAAKIGRKIADEVQAASPKGAGQGVEKGGVAAEKLGVARAGMDASMRDALAEVEKDRSQLSGVIVSRASTSVPSQRPGQGQSQVQGQVTGQGQAQAAGQSREGADACWSSQRDSQQQQQEQSRQRQRHNNSSSGNNMTLSDQIMQGALNARKNNPPSSSASSDGNDEAAMAVIMSLLEADAGLGGPVDFSGLPWPLP